MLGVIDYIGLQNHTGANDALQYLLMFCGGKDPVSMYRFTLRLEEERMRQFQLYNFICVVLWLENMSIIILFQATVHPLYCKHVC